MRKANISILTLICLISYIKATGQSDISMASRWNNRTTYNPAFIARPDYLYLFADTRKQWVGVNGSPLVFNIQASEYFNSIHSAFGLSVVSDRIGVTQVLNPMVTYAYRIAAKQNWTLSMGLSAGIFQRTINGSLFEAETVVDPSLSYELQKTTQPDVNLGFEFQTTYFIYGVSSTHLFSIAKPDNLFLNSNHRYAYAIYKNDDPEMYSYSVGMQVVNRKDFTVIEGSVSFQLKHLNKLILSPLIKGTQETLDVGLSYRSSRQMTMLLGVMISPYLRVGYAYDQSLFSKYSLNGTHEIMIEYRIPARAAATVRRCGTKEFWYH